MSKSRYELLLASSALGALILGGSLLSPAYAQGQPEQPAEAAPAPAPAAEEEEEESADKIVVTGSRIARDEFSSSAPIQVITTEQAELEGISDTASLLQTSTVAAGSPQITTITSTSFVQQGGEGASSVSLRGLGANRTLVLLNSRRAGPAGTRGEVAAFDLNVIPQSIIDRVEILKDGASSIYGSDAVAGVVNIITKTDTDGIEFDAFGTIGSDEGGEEYRVNAGYAKSFNRGSFLVAADYYKQNEMKVGDRSYTSCDEQYTFDTTTGQRNDIIDPRTGQFSCRNIIWGHLWIYDYSTFVGGDSLPVGAKLQFDYNGMFGLNGDLGQYAPTLTDWSQTILPGLLANPPSGTSPGCLPFLQGIANNGVANISAPSDWRLVDVARIAPGFTPSTSNCLRELFGNAFPQALGQTTNLNHPFIQDSTLIPEVERATAFAQGDLKIVGSMEAYGEALLNRRETRTNGVRQFWTYTYTEDWNDQFFGSGGGDPLSAGFTGPLLLSPTAITDHADSNIKVDYLRLLGGLRGDLPFAGWTWDIHAQHSISKGEYTNDRILQDAVDAASFRNPDPFGGVFGIAQPGCVGTPTLPVSGRPCIDINWMTGAFMAGQFTDAERAFLFDTETGETEYTQTTVEGFISGELFKLPAGPLGAAIGAHFREDEIDDVPGEITLANNAWGSTGAGITRGSDKTKEVFGELGVPIINNKPFFQDLNLVVSGRWTDVDSAGDDSTYKFGVNWQVNDVLRLRGTKGTSFRAPALFELYLADQTSFVGQRNIDPCVNWGAALASGAISQRIADNCAADGIPDDHSGAGSSATVVTGGGLGVLKPETSDASTIGFILTPPRFDFSFSLDYFEIEVNEEVSQLGAGGILFLCYNSENFATEPLCGLFDRNGANETPPYLITEVRDSFINIASQTNRGIDVAFRYGHELPFGSLNVNSQMTWTLEDKFTRFPDSPVADLNGDIGEPDWVGNLNFQFDRGAWTGFWGIDMIGGQSAVEDNGGSTTNLAGTTTFKLRSEFTAYHSLSVRRSFEDWSVLVGVRNVFDEHPPALSTTTGLYSTTGTSALTSQYDYVGRRAFVNLSKQF